MARILVVEQDEDSGESLRLLLESYGHEVDLTTTGTVGIQLAVARCPRAVVLDLGLSDMQGEAVATALKAMAQAPFVIAYSGFHQRRSGALAAGCDAFVLKPGLEELMAVLAEAMRPRSAKASARHVRSTRRIKRGRLRLVVATQH